MNQKGFSLLELSIVLLIVALLAGSSIVAGISQANSARTAQTHKKMATIQDALMTFRKANDRLPCPASRTTLSNDFSFGMEFPNPGICTGSLKFENFIAEGAVPVRALSLPDEFMYDGWGQRFTYSVNSTMTMDKAFTASEIDEDCGGIQVRSETATRTDEAAYVILSHGRNGHGGYTNKGVRIASSSNAQEHVNCNCDTSLTPLITFERRFNDFEPVEATINASDQFDDLVAYKSRWQLITDMDKPSSKRWPNEHIELIINDTSAIKAYTRVCNTFDSLDNAKQIPAIATNGRIAVSSNPVYLAVPTGLDSARIFKHLPSSNRFIETTNPPDLTGLTNSYVGKGISRDARWLAVPHEELVPSYSYTVTVYKRNGDDFLRLPPFSTGAPGKAINAFFSDDAKFLGLVMNQPPYIRIIERINDSFRLLTNNAPDVGPPSIAQAISFSKNNSYLAVGYEEISGKTLSIYKRNNDNEFIKLPDIADQPSVQAVSVAFSNDSTYLAVGAANPLESVLVYKRTGDTFTKLAMPAPPSTIHWSAKVSFSRHDNFLAAADLGGNWKIAIYRRSGDAFIPISRAGINPIGSPANNTLDIVFIP